MLDLKKEGLPSEQPQNNFQDKSKVDIYSTRKISLFAKAKSIDPPLMEISVGEILRQTKHGEFRQQVEWLRSLPKDQYDTEKIKRKCVTFGGTFPVVRNKESFETVSGLMILDFDHLENAESFRDSLKKYPWIYSAFVSPRGEGVKAIAVIKSCEDDAEFKQCFASIKNLIPEIDDSGKDISRLCFVSYDPDLWTNPNAVFAPFDPVEIVEVTAPVKVNSKPLQKRHHALSTAERKIAEAPDGEKHNELLKASKLLGGYVATNEIDKDEAFDVLHNAISNRNVKSLPDAIKTIKDGLNHGEKQPIESTQAAPTKATKREHKQHGGEDDWLKNHVFLIPSMTSQNKFAHVLVDESNVCTYYESTSSGRPSEPLREKIAAIRVHTNWPKFDNEGLTVFNEGWIQRDTLTECYLYYKNGTVKVTKKGIEFISGGNRPMVWGSLVLQRDYKHNDNQHEIAQLAELATVDYQKLKIGIGYLLHRHWSRNMTKIVYACDHKPNSRHDGRRGKDLFITLLSLARKWSPVKWKKGATFWTSSIQPDTAIVHFEDVSNMLVVDEEMKKTITGDFSIEHKGQNIVTRKFSDKPKFSASSQKYPLDYMDASIRGRIWLVEFTDYLQKNPPKKTLVYDDSDLSSFDAWIIDCIQTYFQNIQQLIGVSALTPDQLAESLRVVYGSNIINGVEIVADKISREGAMEVSEVLEVLELDKADGKTLIRFKEAFEKVTGNILVRTQRRVDGARVPFYETKK